MENLFKNPGERIKRMAIFSFILTEILLIIGAFACFAAGDYFVLIGLAILVLGTVISYVPALYLYAMGELVDKMTKTEENTRETARVLLLERKEKLDKQIEDASYTYQAPKKTMSFDEQIAQEEDRVEKLAKFSEFTASRLENLQQEFLKGKLTKEEYFAGLQRIN